MPVIREVREGDYDRWIPLWDGYNAFYGRSGETALPREVTKTTWLRFFDPSEPVHALVAEQDDQLLGLTHYLFHRSTTLIPPMTSTHETNAVARSLYDKVAERSGFLVYRKVL